jgi:hypothetical protein
MNLHEQSDPILRALNEVAPIEPSAGFERRVLLRSHAALARRRRREIPAIQPPAVRTRLADVAMAAAIGLYATLAAMQAVILTLQ